MSPEEVQARIRPLTDKALEAFDALLDEAVLIRRLHEGASFEEAVAPTLRAMFAVDFGALLISRGMDHLGVKDATMRYALAVRTGEQVKAALIKVWVKG